MRVTKNKGGLRMRCRRSTCAIRGSPTLSTAVLHELVAVYISRLCPTFLPRSSHSRLPTYLYHLSFSPLFQVLTSKTHPSTMSTSTFSSRTITTTPATAPKKPCHNRRVECCTLSHVTYRMCGHTISYKTQYCDGSVCGPEYYSTYRISSPDRCGECAKRVERNARAVGHMDEQGYVEMSG